MIKINRKDRRKQEREESKEGRKRKKEINAMISNDLKVSNVNKYDNSLMALQSEQAKFIAEISRKQADKIVTNRLEEMQSILDRCITAFLIETFPEYSWSEIAKEEDRLAEIMEEDAEKYVYITGGSESMVTKKIKDLEAKTEERCKELIERGFNQQRIIENLKVEFKELSTAMAAVAYKKVKSSLDETIKDINEYLNQNEKTIQSKDTELNVKYIAKTFKVGEKLARKCYEQWKEEYCKSKLTPAEIEELRKEIKEKNQEKAKRKQEKLKKDSKKEEVKEEKKLSKLKVVKKVMEVEGEFGKYVIDGNVITKGEEKFNSIADIEKYEKAEIEKFAKQMAELREVAGMA